MIYNTRIGITKKVTNSDIYIGKKLQSKFFGTIEIKERISFDKYICSTIKGDIIYRKWELLQMRILTNET
jgi:hypothetical protein